MDQTAKSGIVYGLSAYTIWAVAPMYFKSIDYVPPLDILSHRVLWSLLIVLVLIFALGKSKELFQAVRSPKTVLAMLLSSTLIGVNWGTFIWAINSNMLLSASLGYYINPLVNIVLGMMFFKDKLDRPKRWAALLCLAAVLFEIVQFGRLPWVALTLAMTFGLYGLVRKKVAVSSFTGMALETAMLMPFALIQLVWFGSEFSAMTNNDLSTNLLLIAAGPVTMVPLMFFAAAANRISLVTLGFFQYIGPSAMFLLAVFVYGEPFAPEKLITFGLIWAALVLLILSSLRQLKRAKKPLTQAS